MTTPIKQRIAEAAEIKYSHVELKVGSELITAFCNSFNNEKREAYVAGATEFYEIGKAETEAKYAELVRIILLQEINEALQKLQETK